MSPTDPDRDLEREAEQALEAVQRTPRHGFQGDRATRPPVPQLPAGLTIAISREAGAGGTTLGRRVGRRLGWQVYDQELLEYVSQEGAFRQDVLDTLSAPCAAWADERLQALLREQNVSQHPSIVNLARVILALGAQGEVVLIGRGAGCILPPASTLNVRVIAPLADRIAYLSQWLRLTIEAAAEQVRLRDDRRAEFIATHFHRRPADAHQYDLLVNASLLGEDLCVELIAQAAEAKQRGLSDE